MYQPLCGASSGCGTKVHEIYRLQKRISLQCNVCVCVCVRANRGTVAAYISCQFGGELPDFSVLSLKPKQRSSVLGINCVSVSLQCSLTFTTMHLVYRIYRTGVTLLC